MIRSTTLALACMMALGLSGMSSPQAHADEWKFLEPDTRLTFSALSKNPKPHEHKTVVIHAQIKGPGSLFLPFLAEFSKDDDYNFQAWDDNAALWLDSGVETVFPTLYISRANNDFEKIRAAKPYARFILKGEVTNVVEGVPIIKVLKATKILKPTYTKSVINNMRKALKWHQSHELKIAQDHLTFVLDHKLPHVGIAQARGHMGQLYYEQGEYAKAIAQYDRAIKDIGWHLGLAKKWVRAGIEGAIHKDLKYHGDLIVKADPESALGRLAQAIHLVDIDKSKDSIALFDKSIFRDSSNGWAFHWKGKAKRNLGDLEDATIQQRKALLKDPNREEFRAELADVLFVRERYVEAAPEYHMLHEEMGIKNPFYPYRLGLCYEKMEKTGKAEKYYKAALAIDENYMPALETLSDLYFNQKQFAEAKPLYARIAKLDERHTDARLKLGLIHWRDQELDQAETRFTEIIKINKKHVNGRHFLARLIYQRAMPSDENPEEEVNQDRVAESFKHFRYLLKYNPDNHAIRLDYAIRAVDQHRYDISVEQYEVLKHVKSMRKRSLMNLGFGYLELREYEKSETAYKDAIKEDDKMALAYNNLAYLYLTDLPKHTEGMTLAKKAYQLDPESEAILDTLGWAHYVHGEYEKALTLIKQASAKSNIADIQYHLGLCYFKLDNLPKAKEVLASIDNANEREARLIKKALAMVEKAMEERAKAKPDTVEKKAIEPAKEVSEPIAEPVAK